VEPPISSSKLGVSSGSEEGGGGGGGGGGGEKRGGGGGGGDPMERDHFEDLGFDGRIML